jgi:hypothetical protein
MSESGVKVRATGVTTLDSKTPVNSVRNSCIENTSTQRSKPAFFRSSPGVYLIGSFSHPGNTYTVIRNKNTDHWTCQCKGFRYRGECSHIDICRGYEEAISCGYAVPTEEDVIYYAVLEFARANRQKRGIPIEAP